MTLDFLVKIIHQSGEVRLEKRRETLKLPGICRRPADVLLQLLVASIEGSDVDVVRQEIHLSIAARMRSTRLLEQIEKPVLVLLEDAQPIEFALQLEGLGAVL